MIARTGSIVRAIAKVTLLEILRDKILYNIILFTFILFAMGVLASQLEVTHPDRMILDFGLSALSISCSMIAILVGACLLGREFEKRTIHLALSRPVTRAQFILGKYSGLAVLLMVNWVFLVLVYLGLLYCISDGSTYGPSAILGVGLFFMLLQSLILGALSLLISTFSSTSLTVVIALGFYLIGMNISKIQRVANRSENAFTAATLKMVATFLPDFEHFHQGVQLTYGLPVNWLWVGNSVIYGLILLGLMLIGAGVVIETRNL